MKDKPKNSTDVRFRLTNELHEPLKDMAKKEQRSMNYLMNKAVELLLKQESAKAWNQQAQKNLAIRQD